MDDRALGAEPSELENALARWAARVAAVFLVVSMAAMPSMMAWLDAEEDAATTAADIPTAARAPVRAPDPQAAALSPDRIGQPGAGLSVARAGISASAGEDPAAQRPVSDSAGTTQAGLWSSPADRISIPLQPSAGAAEPESLAELSDEEWLTHVMQRVGERANRTAAAAFRALDGFLFENRPSKKGIALLPPPGETGPLPVPGIPVLALPQPAGPDADLIAQPAAPMNAARPSRAPATRPGIAPDKADTARPVTDQNRSAPRIAQADRSPAAAAPRPPRSGAPLSLKSPEAPASLRSAAAPSGSDDRRSSQGPVNLRR